MSNHHVLPTLASRITSTNAQQTLLRVAAPEIRERLASNKELDREVWDKLAVKSNVMIATWLAHRSLDDAQVRVMLKDKRKKVRQQLFHYGLVDCTPEMATEVVASKSFTAEDAATWLHRGGVPENVIKQVAWTENGAHQVRLLIREDLYSVEEACDILSGVQTGHAYTALLHLVDERPELLPYIARMTNHHALEAASGSRHLQPVEAGVLVDFAVANITQRHAARDITITLLANPNVPCDQIDRLLPLLESMRYQTTSSRHRGAPDRAIVGDAVVRRTHSPELGPITCAWETATGNDEVRVKAAMKALGQHRYPTLKKSNGQTPGTSNSQQRPTVSLPFELVDLTDMEVNVPGSHHKMNEALIETLNTKLDPLGEKGWEAFWSLLPDWTSSLGDLVDSSIQLSL